MPENETKPTKVSVKTFISGVKNETRKEDAKVLLKLFEKVSGWKSRMWGPTIIGCGVYHYTYATGHTGTSPVIGFSPRQGNLVVYVFDFPGKAGLLKKLGKHRGGIKRCLYINKLADIDIAILAQILKCGIAKARSAWPVTAR